MAGEQRAIRRRSLLLTFVTSAYTLPNVIYSQIRILISLVMVVILGIGFLWGGTRVLNSVIGAAPPLPTPTVVPLVAQPQLNPSSTGQNLGTKHRGSVSRATPTPKPAPTATPVPSPTPNTPPKVFVVANETDTTPVSTFHVSDGLSRVWCRVRNSAVPPGTTTLSYFWTQEPDSHYLTQYYVTLSGGTYSDGWFRSTASGLTPGKYRCDVSINNESVGTARFTVVP